MSPERGRAGAKVAPMRNVSRAALALPLGAVVLAAVLAGCSGEDRPAADGSTTVSVGGPPITVCSDLPYPPFEFTADDGTTTGFDHDLIEAMARSAGHTVTFVPTPIDAIIAALDGGQCRVAASALTINDVWAESVAFSDPYLDVDQSLLVRAEDAERFRTLADLDGRTVGVQAGTSGADQVAAQGLTGVRVQELQTADELVPALVSGDVDAVVQDQPLNAHLLTHDDRFAITQVIPTGQRYGFATARSDTEMLTELDTALEQLRADGTYDEIHQRWFGPPT